VTGALLAAALLAGFLALQVGSGRAGLFLKAHGEQVFGILASPHEAARYLGRPLPTGRPARLEAAALGAALVRANLPDLGRLAGVVAWPGPSAQPGWRALRADPPQLPLYFLPLLPFVVLGASSSLRRWRAWPDALLLAWVAITVAAALLSNRVDHHRLMTLCIPLCVWLGVGLNLALALLRRAGLPRVARGALLGALAVAALLEAAWQLERPRPIAGSPLVAATEQALRALDGPVSAAFAADFRERTEAQLLVLERERALGLPPHEPLRMRLQQALDDPRQRPQFADTLVLAIGNTVGSGTLLLGPATDTLAIARGLEAQGFRVRPLDGPVGLFVVTAPANGVSGP
jgi:hypothetical protein